MMLTVKQLDVLSQLDTKDSSAYSMKASLSTIEALQHKGLVVAIGHGHMAFPRVGTWRITAAGRAALATVS